jgi:glycosyltransferase involved in cell wall biosynthesis
MSNEITQIGVVVPAHNEEVALPGCLAALQTAARAIPLPVRILVVLDDCADRSGEICARFGVETCAITAGNVGEARASGARVLLRHERSPQQIWLSSTDADTRVGPTWLRDQVALSRRGADVVLGVVRLGNDGPSSHLRHAFDADYKKLFAEDGTHGHVHGANLGIKASVYLRAGGFPPLANHEDRGLVQRLRAMSGVTIQPCQRLDVHTSGRLDGRCEHGFAATLTRIADPVPAPTLPAPWGPWNTAPGAPWTDLRG